MKKLLLFVFTFIFLILPVFSANTNNSIFVPELNKTQVKKAIIWRSLNTGWQIKQDSEYTLDIYRIKTDMASMMLYGTNFNMKPEERVHFNLLENKNGVTISYTTNISINPNSGYEKLKYTPLLDYAVNEMLKDLFLGNYNYYIKYRIKKDYILISDTPQTTYADKNRIGGIYKIIVKIDDKEINKYNKNELKALFLKCEKDKIKLESNEDGGPKIYNLLKTYTAPTYKEYL